MKRWFRSGRIVRGLTLLTAAASAAGPSLQEVRYVETAHEAGIDFLQTSGGPEKSYIPESNGGGVALLDYDRDGFWDIYFVNGSTFEAQGDIGPRNRLYRNLGDGHFKDVTEKAGVGDHGWGMGASSADFDNDGFPDLYITNLGPNILYRNNGDGTFSDVTSRAGVTAGGWSSGSAWGDYDGDGHLDLYVARYLDFSRSETPPKGSGKSCQYRGLAVQCGPRGLRPLADLLYRNNGDGTFRDATRDALGDAPSLYGYTPLWADLDGDGDLDLYVANDGQPNLLYDNLGDGRLKEIGVFSGAAYGRDGKEQAGMGADVGDFDGDGRPDLLVTNFSDDYDTLYRNLGERGFEDVSAKAGLESATWSRLGWAAKFIDIDLDGWKDLFVVNGHVYPEVDDSQSGTRYRQLPQVFLNRSDATFEEVSGRVFPTQSSARNGRGAAFGDIDNDGDIDVVINNLDGPAELWRADSPAGRAWIEIELEGSRCNRDAIGARVRLRAGGRDRFDQVHQCGGFFSSNDKRLHFGLGALETVDEIEIRWPSGLIERRQNLNARQILRLKEGLVHAAKTK